MPVSLDVLSGRRILLTRSPRRAAPLVQALERLGARVEARPTFRLEALEPTCLPLDPAGYDGWVFTSAAGVEFFMQWVEARGGAEAPGWIGCVGQATAAELERRGLAATLVARQSSGAGLGEELVRSWGTQAPSARLLVIRPEVSDPELVRRLEAAGMRVDAVPFYRNLPARDLPQVVQGLEGGAWELVLFSSPSSLLHLLDHGGQASRAALSRLVLVAIGPTTARAMEQAGLVPAAIAASPDVPGMVAALAAAASG